MLVNRRNFFKTASISTVGFWGLGGCQTEQSPYRVDYSSLDRILEQPVLKRDLFSEPIIIESLELLRYKDSFICRVRSTDGAEGLSVSNNMQMKSLWPIFCSRLQPFFPGRDARDLEKIIDEIYVYKSNYKLQSLALWVPLATIEFAILDMLGKIAGKPIGELIGTIHQIGRAHV